MYGIGTYWSPYHCCAPSHGLAIAWKLMVHDSDDFCNSI